MGVFRVLEEFFAFNLKFLTRESRKRSSENTRYKATTTKRLGLFRDKMLFFARHDMYYHHLKVTQAE